MPFDKQKNQRKAFCFITFDSEQVVNELLKTPKQTISGKEVDVKKATPKPDNVPAFGGIGGPRGGPRGRQVRGKLQIIVFLNQFEILYCSLSRWFRWSKGMEPKLWIWSRKWILQLELRWFVKASTLTFLD